MGKRANPAVVGAFVVGAVLLAVIVVAAFGSGRLFRTTYAYVLYFSGDVNGLNVGAPVKFKGVPVGSVKSILLHAGTMKEFAKPAAEVRIPVIIELDAQQVRGVGATLTPDPETIKTLVGLGMRARLSLQSFVTGVLYVNLDMHPDSELRLVADPTVKYVEIPTLPTPLEEAQLKVTQFLAKLADYDVRALLDSIASAVSGIDHVVNSPDLRDALAAVAPAVRKVDTAFGDLQTTLGSVRQLVGNVNIQVAPLAKNVNEATRNATDALADAKVALGRVAAFLDPDAPVPYQLGQTLGDVSIAARAVRRLAEDMERNPTALIRGRAISESEP